MQRQISVQCIERGDLLQRIIDGYEEISEFSLENNSFAIENTKKTYEEKIFDLTNSFASEIVTLNTRVENLEKEKED